MRLQQTHAHVTSESHTKSELAPVHSHRRGHTVPATLMPWVSHSGPPSANPTSHTFAVNRDPIAPDLRPSATSPLLAPEYTSRRCVALVETAHRLVIDTGAHPYVAFVNAGTHLHIAFIDAGAHLHLAVVGLRLALTIPPGARSTANSNKLFGVDTREDGRLKHIRRGEHGMSFVASHLAGLDWKSGKYPLDLVGIKLQRVVNEMEYLCAAGTEIEAAQPSKPKQLMKKRLDATGRKGTDIVHTPVDGPVFVFRFQEDLLAVPLYSNSAHKYPVYPTYRYVLAQS
ncbi:hypothetical protein B0H14DRAFT_2630618 [Mycena olivaceomarginata]|nr:hypothetical protein B0H14DRAFT_2630618 [Mycena olivaceomarginata]